MELERFQSIVSIYFVANVVSVRRKIWQLFGCLWNVWKGPKETEFI